MDWKQSPPGLKFSITAKQRQDRWEEVFAKYEVPYEGEAALELSMIEWEERAYAPHGREGMALADRKSVRRSAILNKARRDEDDVCFHESAFEIKNNSSKEKTKDDKLHVTNLRGDLTEPAVKKSWTGNKRVHRNGVLATKVDDYEDNWMDADSFIFGGKTSSAGKDLTVASSGVLEISRVPVVPETKLNNIVSWLLSSPGPPRSDPASSDVDCIIDRGRSKSSSQASVPVDHAGSFNAFPSASPAHRMSSAMRSDNKEPVKKIASSYESRNCRSNSPTIVGSLSCSEITSPRYPALILPTDGENSRKSSVASRPSFKSRRSSLYKDKRGMNRRKSVSLGVDDKSVNVTRDSLALGSLSDRKLNGTGVERDSSISRTTAECSCKTVSRLDSAKPREVALVFRSEGVAHKRSYIPNLVEMRSSSLKKHQSDKENGDCLACVVEEDVKTLRSEEKSCADVYAPHKCHLKSDGHCFDGLSHDSFKDCSFTKVMQVDVCDVSLERKEVKGSRLGTDVVQIPHKSNTALWMSKVIQSNTDRTKSPRKKSRIDSIADSVMETGYCATNIGGAAKVDDSPFKHDSVKNVDLILKNTEEERNVSRDSDRVAARSVSTARRNKISTTLNNSNSVVGRANELKENFEKTILPSELRSKKNSSRSLFSRYDNSLSAGYNKTNVTGIFDKLSLNPQNITPRWEGNDTTLSASRTIEFEIVTTSDEESIHLPPRFRKSFSKNISSTPRVVRNHQKLLSSITKKANVTTGKRSETMQGNSVSASNKLGLEVSGSSADRFLEVTRVELNSTGTKRGQQKKENTFSAKLPQSVGDCERVTDVSRNVLDEQRYLMHSKLRVDQNVLYSSVSVSKLIGLNSSDTTKLQTVSTPVNHLQETLSPRKNCSVKDLQEERVHRKSMKESADKGKPRIRVTGSSKAESLLQGKVDKPEKEKEKKVCTSDSNKTNANSEKKSIITKKSGRPNK